MRVSGAALFSAGLAAVAAYAVFAALKWPFKAALFPMVLGIPLALLALVQVVLELRSRSEPAAPAAVCRTAAIFGWMAGFILLVLLAGFPLAVPLFVFAFLASHRTTGWGLSIVLAAATWGVFHALFERLLHFPFEAGLIQAWLFNN